MSNVTRAASGEEAETDTVNGADSYSTGGISIGTNLGSVDDATVEVDNPNYQAQVEGTSGPHLTVVLYTATVDTTTSNASQSVDWSEVADATDISADWFTYTAVSQ